jgi:ABC-2 type transport system permease protein
MRHTWAMSKVRMRLALRNRAFIFFSLIMPLAFLFLYNAVFGRSGPYAVDYLLAKVLALSAMGSFWGLSLQLVSFREQGVLRRFRLAPVDAGALLASSIVSNYFLTVPTIVLEFAISRWLFHMATWGNLWSVFVLVSVGTATFSAMGLIVASVTNSLQETQVINNAIWFVFLFLSGATLPLPILPLWIQHVALYSPATYLVTGLEQAMVAHTGVLGIVGNVAALAVSLLVAFEVSRRMFRWEPEEKVPGKAKAWAAAALIPFLLFGAWENVYGKRLAGAQQIYQSIERKAPSMPGAPH